MINKYIRYLVLNLVLFLLISNFVLCKEYKNTYKNCLLDIYKQETDNVLKNCSKFNIKYKTNLKKVKQVKLYTLLKLKKYKNVIKLIKKEKLFKKNIRYLRFLLNVAYNKQNKVKAHKIITFKKEIRCQQNAKRSFLQYNTFKKKYKTTKYQLKIKEKNNKIHKQLINNIYYKIKTQEKITILENIEKFIKYSTKKKETLYLLSKLNVVLNTTNIYLYKKLFKTHINNLNYTFTLNLHKELTSLIR